MNILAKCMTAIAISALVAGPAAAVGFEVDYVGEKGSIKLSGDNCSVEKEKNIFVDAEVFGDGFLVKDFEAGPNTGIWDVFLSGFELGEFDGEGTFVIEKRGKDVTEAPLRATLGVSNDLFFNIVDEIGDYASVACKNFEGFESEYCQQTKGHAEWSKDGEQLQFKVQVVCKYHDDGDKVKKVQARIVSGKLDVVLDH